MTETVIRNQRLVIKAEALLNNHVSETNHE